MATISACYIKELTPGQGTDIDGVVFGDGNVALTSVTEVTSGNGITINNVSFKDGAVVGLDASDARYVHTQLNAAPTAVSGGSLVWIDDGSTATQGDAFVTLSDGSTSNSYCICPISPYSQQVYSAGTDIGGSGNQTIASVTLGPGTYLMSYTLARYRGAATVAYFRVTGSVDGTIEESKMHIEPGISTAATPCNASFIVTNTESSQTYTLQGNNNTGNATLVQMQTATVNGASIGVNNPVFSVLRIA